MLNNHPIKQKASQGIYLRPNSPQKWKPKNFLQGNFSVLQREKWRSTPKSSQPRQRNRFQTNSIVHRQSTIGNRQSLILRLKTSPRETFSTGNSNDEWQLP